MEGAELSVQRCLCISYIFLPRFSRLCICPRIFEISIFHFRVARYSRRTDATTERVGICNTCFRVRRVSHGFCFTLTYIIPIRRRFQRHYHRLVFSPSYFAFTSLCMFCSFYFQENQNVNRIKDLLCTENLEII